MAYRSWSLVSICPDCHAETLRVYWSQRDDEPPRTVDEFCDNPGCTRGD